VMGWSWAFRPIHSIFCNSKLRRNKSSGLCNLSVCTITQWLRYKKNKYTNLGVSRPLLPAIVGPSRQGLVMDARHVFSARTSGNGSLGKAHVVHVCCVRIVQGRQPLEIVVMGRQRIRRPRCPTPYKIFLNETRSQQESLKFVRH
jgi:hypothetical protein